MRFFPGRGVRTPRKRAGCSGTWSSVPVSQTGPQTRKKGERGVRSMGFILSYSASKTEFPFLKLRALPHSGSSLRSPCRKFTICHRSKLAKRGAQDRDVTAVLISVTCPAQHARSSSPRLSPPPAAGELLILHRPERGSSRGNSGRRVCNRSKNAQVTQGAPPLGDAAGFLGVLRAGGPEQPPNAAQTNTPVIISNRLSSEQRPLVTSGVPSLA